MVTSPGPKGDKGDDPVTSTDYAGATPSAHSCRCGGGMVRLEVESRLSVHLPGDSSEAHWTTTPLDSWTCTECGMTEFFARNPRLFRR